MTFIAWFLQEVMLGVDWTLKILSAHPDVWNVDADSVAVIRAKAEKIIQAKGWD